MSGDILTQAINTADLERLQTVLRNICYESEIYKALVSKQLLVEETDSEKFFTDEEEEEEEEKSPPPPRGKKRPRYAICSLCRQEFDVTENLEEACYFHDGIGLEKTGVLAAAAAAESEADHMFVEELEPLYDMWPDHDEDCHGPIDTDENKVNISEGFEWDFREGQANAKGCQTGWHEEETNFRPKAVKRYTWG